MVTGLTVRAVPAHLGKLLGLAVLVVGEDLQLLTEVDLAHRHPVRHGQDRGGRS